MEKINASLHLGDPAYPIGILFWIPLLLGGNSQQIVNQPTNHSSIHGPSSVLVVRIQGFSPPLPAAMKQPVEAVSSA